MKNLSIFLFYLGISISLAWSQTIDWSVSLGSTGDEYGAGIDNTADGGAIVIGTTNSTAGNVTGNHGGNDIWLVKLDAAGTLQWQKCLGGTGDDVGFRVFQQADGGYILAGITTSNDGDVSGNHGMSDIWLAKTDATGNVLWQSCLGDIDADGSNYSDMVLLSDESVVIAYPTLFNACYAGVSCGGSGTNMTGVNVTRISNMGLVMWDTCASPNDQSTYIWEYEYSAALTLLPNGDIASHTNWQDDNCGLGGTKSGVNDYVYDANTGSFTYITTSAGNGTASLFYPYIVQKTSLGGAKMRLFYDNTHTIIFGKYGLSGTEIWRVNVGNGVQFTQDADSAFWIVGTYATGANGGRDMLVVKMKDFTNYVTGTAKWDSNGNMLPDANELGYANLFLKAQNGAATMYAMTDSNGYYNLRSSVGNDTLTPQNVPLYHTATPATYYLSFPTNNFLVDNLNDFAITPTPNIADLRAILTTYTPPMPGFDNEYDISYKNVGTMSMNGSVRYNFDINQTYLSASPAPDTLTATYAAWNFSNLASLANGSISVMMNTNLNSVLGTLATPNVWVSPIVGDQAANDNLDTLHVTIVGAYDPNDKIVAPAGEVTHAFIQNQEYLTYTVLFQNTGNAAATNVVVRDTFSHYLDITTFEILATSHACSPSYDFISQSFAFHFDNIMLPDSHANAPQSHGFVKFRVKPLATVPDCKKIENRAGIYFDFNPPILTGTTTTKVKLTPPVITPLGPTTFCHGGSVTLSGPNGMSSYTWSSNGSHAQTVLINGYAGTHNQYLTIQKESGCSATSAALPVIIIPSPGLPIITITGNDTFCQGNHVILTAPYNLNYTYSWSDGTSTRKDTVTQSGIYSVTVTNQYNCSKTSTATNVVANPLPAIPTIFQNVNVLTSSASTGNQWYFNGIAISGGTGFEYVATQNGNYSVTVTDSNGCSSSSVPYPFVLIGDNTDFAQSVSIYPNPTSAQVFISFEKTSDAPTQISLHNALGQVLYQHQVSEMGKAIHSIDLSGFAEGIYNLEIWGEEGLISQQIAVQKP